MSNTVLLKNVKLSFPSIFEAQQYQGQGDFKYAASFLITPGSENDKAVRAAIDFVAKSKWPKTYVKNMTEIAPDKKAMCYIEGNRREYEGYKDMMALSAKRSKKQGAPAIIDRQKNPITSDDGRVYAGCFVNAKCELWAQDSPQMGIRCTLVAIQFWADGPAFGGGSKPTTDEFEIGEDLSNQGDELI